MLYITGKIIFLAIQQKKRNFLAAVRFDLETFFRTSVIMTSFLYELKALLAVFCLGYMKRQLRVLFKFKLKKRGKFSNVYEILPK